MAQAKAAGKDDLTEHLINVAPALPAVAIALIAISLHYSADFGLAYRGGVEAWTSGHPQRIVTWTATPFLALVMALVSRAGSEYVEARVFMALDIALWMVLLFVVWSRLRPHVSPAWWWATLAAAAFFAPAVSTIFWLQFNLVILALALGGFVLAGRRDGWAAWLIGLSIALKPIVILLPLALLLRRRTRAAGAWSIAVTAVSTVAGLAFLAWRAGDPSLLNPLAYLEGFIAKGQGAIAACIVENYSPVAMLCRLGLQPSTLTTAAVGVIVLGAGYVLVRGLPDTPQGSWEVFAASCFLSVMLGPIDWAHYGLLMGPLYLLLAYQFWRYGAPAFLWVGLALSFALIELVWDPLASLAGASIPLEVFVYTAGQFGQYFLLLTWIRWRSWQRSPTSSRTWLPVERRPARSTQAPP